MALRWYATQPIFNSGGVRAFNRGDWVPDSTVSRLGLNTGGRVVQVDVPAQNPATVLRPLTTGDRDTDVEREYFIPSRLSEGALRAASVAAVQDAIADGVIEVGGPGGGSSVEVVDHGTYVTLTVA